MEHPSITRTLRTGYPRPEKIYGTDQLGNTVYSGDEILCLDHMFFLKHALSHYKTRALFDLGATHHIAE